MSQLDKYVLVMEAARALVAAEKSSLKCAANRGNADAGSSRAKITTLNARWATMAEHRDRCAHELHCVVVEANLADPYDERYYGEITTHGGNWLINRRHPKVKSCAS